MLSPPRTSLQPFEALMHRAQSDAAAPQLLILLPGVNIVPEDFSVHGFITALHDARGAIDAAAVAIGSTDYLEDDFSARLDQAVIAPAQAAGYQRIALLGISLGVFGALRYLREIGTGAIGELVMIAPFLGTPGLIAEVEKAGGLDAWSCVPRPRDIERRNLLWLRGALAKPPLPLSLGFGTQDRFAAAMVDVARHLPQQQVTVRPGGHDWDTWRTLWPAMLETPILQGGECRP